MLKGFTLIACILIFLASLISAQLKDANDWESATPVSEVLNALGVNLPAERPSNMNKEMVQKGKALIHKGRAENPDRKMGAYISKYYDCTSCHNTVVEDPDLSESNPEDRLAYARKNNIPFLQGTTLKGVVNRESWYNGDYEKKYGDLVKDARNSLKGAIHLCATVCAQGRELKNWEMDAILAYLWSIEYTLGDLGFTGKEIKPLEKQAGTSGKNKEVIKKIKGRYLQASPATFSDPPENKQTGYKHEGNPEKGEAIYRQSCQHCHFPDGVSDLVLDTDRLTMKKLLRNKDKENEKSFYHIIRHGTEAYPGHRPYMPLYPQERMSNRQVEHLRAFIEKKAGGD